MGEFLKEIQCRTEAALGTDGLNKLINKHWNSAKPEVKAMIKDTADRGGRSYQFDVHLRGEYPHCLASPYYEVVKNDKDFDGFTLVWWASMSDIKNFSISIRW